MLCRWGWHRWLLPWRSLCHSAVELAVSHTGQASLASGAGFARPYFEFDAECRWITMPCVMEYPHDMGPHLGSADLTHLLIPLMLSLNGHFPWASAGVMNRGCGC